MTASRPSTFTVLFLLNAATFLLYVGFLPRLRGERPVTSRPFGILLPAALRRTPTG